jgi:hypothetical protein
MKNTKENWVYEYDKGYPYKGKSEYDITGVRYILGKVFDPNKKKVLICIGINPSTAIPEHLDPTLNRVQKYAVENGYGAWYMLNIYPQRATKPIDIHKEPDLKLHQRNLEAIKKLLTTIKEADVWCAWGSIITKRYYLKSYLKDVISVLGDKFEFVERKSVGKQYKHPLHPIASVKTKVKLAKFNIEKYLKNL